MNQLDAERVLAEADDLVVCLQAPLGDAKSLRDACLELDIPVLLDRGACCGAGGCGCAPKIDVIARTADVSRVAQLLHDRWQALALREGTVTEWNGVQLVPATDDAAAAHPPCPACGTTAALVAGACSDCGLQLE